METSLPEPPSNPTMPKWDKSSGINYGGKTLKYSNNDRARSNIYFKAHNASIFPFWTSSDDHRFIYLLTVRPSLGRMLQFSLRGDRKLLC